MPRLSTVYVADLHCPCIRVYILPVPSIGIQKMDCIFVQNTKVRDDKNRASVNSQEILPVKTKKALGLKVTRKLAELISQFQLIKSGFV